ncbi:nurim homolog [Euwallacea similis]|uniref:nurim homolog n=1 Tax=Euwallacea similis TaxID=1736056 RepID=UPI00344EEDFA
MITKVLKLIKLLFALSSFICVFYVILELTYFLSFPKPVLHSKEDLWLTTSRALLTDMVLLSLFVLQHSAMASESFKSLLYNLRISDISRSIYITATAAVLLVAIKYWTFAPYVLWDINLNYKPVLYLYIGFHCIAWTVIYVANVCTDVTELLGLKQVYYSIMNLPNPNLRKSLRLQKLNAHMRHPSFLGFLLVFWFIPVMSLDRLLLATILTGYMYIAWNTDGEDYNYQKYMFQRKHHELERLSS